MHAGKKGKVGIVAAEKPELEVKASHPKLGLAGMGDDSTINQAGKGAN